MEASNCKASDVRESESMICCPWTGVPPDPAGPEINLLSYLLVDLSCNIRARTNRGKEAKITRLTHLSGAFFDAAHQKYLSFLPKS
jgi:hypothetical protein